MKGSELTRRDFARRAAVALGGLVTGSIMGCEGGGQPADAPVGPTPAEGQKPNGSGPREPNGSAPREPNGSAPREPDRPRAPDLPREPTRPEPQEPAPDEPRDEPGRQPVRTGR